MAYNTGIPNGSDAMQLSCPQLRGNFTQIYNAFLENHLPLNDPNQGMHSQLEMVQQGSDPTTESNEVALYSKAGTGSQPQIFFMPASTGTPIQISNGVVINSNPLGPYYQSFIAGPYIVLFGMLTGVNNGQTITYTDLYPGISFSEIEFVDLQLIQSSTPLISGSRVGPFFISTTSFRVAFTGLTLNGSIYYLVIGKPS